MMSNKNTQFVRRYTKRETSKRDFRIVKTWSTPKESDSEPHSGPSGLTRLGHVLSSDPNSSDSSDVTYHPTESSELPTGSGQSTAPATSSETPAAQETETQDTDTQETETETQGAQETETTPIEPEKVTETSSETAEYVPRSTTQSSGNSREASSSPTSTSTSDTSESGSGETSESSRKESSEVSKSARKSSRKVSSKKKNSREKTPKGSSASKGGTGENKWTVKNWKDVDILNDDNQTLTTSLVSDVPGPSGDQQDRQKTALEASGHEESPAPPDLVHEPHAESGSQEDVESVELPERQVYHEDSPAPPELVHEPSADQPLPEDSSLSSPSPVGADEPPELEMAERNDTSDTNNVSNISTSSRTLSVRLERIQVELYQAKNNSDRVETSESPDRETEEKTYSEPEDKITSSQDTNRKPYKMKGRGPKSVQRKRKAAQKASVSDCDSSTIEQSTSHTGESTKDLQQLVSSSGKDSSVSPPEKKQGAVDPNRIETDEEDESAETPIEKNTSSQGSAMSNTRSTSKQKSKMKGKVEASLKASEVVKQSVSKKGTETQSRQSSPESGLVSNVEESTRSRKEKYEESAVKETPKKTKVSTKAKATKHKDVNKESSFEQDSLSEEETSKQSVEKAGSTKGKEKQSRPSSPESGPASDAEDTTRSGKKRSETSAMIPKKAKVSKKAKPLKFQGKDQESSSEEDNLSEHEESSKQLVRQTGSRKGTETPSGQTSPESGLASDVEQMKRIQKKKSVMSLKGTPKKVKVSKAKASKSEDLEEDFLSEEDKCFEQEVSAEQPLKQTRSRKEKETSSRPSSPESRPASDVEEITRSRKKKSDMSVVKQTPKKAKVSVKAKPSKSHGKKEESSSEMEDLSEHDVTTKQPTKQTGSRKEKTTPSDPTSPESGLAIEVSSRSRKKKSEMTMTPKKAKVSKAKASKSQDIEEEFLSGQDKLSEQKESEKPVKQTGARKGLESGPESDVEETRRSRKKKSDVSFKEMPKKAKVSKAKASKSKDVDQESLSDQDKLSEQEDSSHQNASVSAGKKQPEIMTRPSKTPRRSRTSSSSTHEEETAQTKRAKLAPGQRGRTSTDQEAVEDSNDDAHSVASSLRLEGIDFEKTPQTEPDVTKLPGASPSSLWKGKKISAVKPRAWSPRRREHTSSVASDDMSMVSTMPTEKKLTKKAKPVKKSTAKQPKQKSAKKPRAKLRRRREQGSDDEDNYAGRSITVWSQSNQPRRGTDILDLDIVLECLQSVEREMYEEAESRPCEKATQKVGSFIRKEIHKTISQVQEIKHNQSESKKLRSSVRNLRAELQEKQVDKIKLNAKLKKLKAKTGIDEDLINLNSWLDDYDKLMKSWDQSKSSHSKQQKYRWIGDIPDDMKTLF